MVLPGPFLFPRSTGEQAPDTRESFPFLQQDQTSETKKQRTKRDFPLLVCDGLLSAPVSLLLK